MKLLEFKFVLRVYSPSQLGRITEFVRSVVCYWGTLSTGGAIIGGLAIWQNTNHPVRPVWYWAIGISAFFAACFKAWKEKVILLEKVLNEINAEKQATSKELVGPLLLSANKPTESQPTVKEGPPVKKEPPVEEVKPAS